MLGRARWLAVGVVAGWVGAGLWWHVPATQPDAPGKTAQTEKFSAASEVGANGAEGRPSHGRPAEAARVEAFEDLKQRAKAGDALAQRLLAETYEGCYFINIDREKFMGNLDFNKQMIRAPAQLSVDPPPEN